MACLHIHFLTRIQSSHRTNLILWFEAWSWMKTIWMKTACYSCSVQRENIYCCHMTHRNIHHLNSITSSVQRQTNMNTFLQISCHFGHCLDRIKKKKKTHTQVAISPCRFIRPKLSGLHDKSGWYPFKSSKCVWIVLRLSGEHGRDLRVFWGVVLFCWEKW